MLARNMRCVVQRYIACTTETNMTPQPDNPDRLVSRIEVSARAGSFLGDVRIRLLEMIDVHRSITQAARQVPMSYKAAWDAVDAMNNLAPQVLVERTTGGRQGGGSRLSAYGRQVVAMYRALAQRNQDALDLLVHQLDAGVPDDPQRFARLLRRMDLRTSARNQFACRITALHERDVNCEVLLAFDDDDAENMPALLATVMRDAASELALAVGDEVLALVKASAVQLVSEASTRAGLRNQMPGVVARIERGPLNAEVVLDVGGGKRVTALLSAEGADELELQPGRPACAVFKASSVVLVLA